MTSVAFGESHDFHGCQVAVGTIVTSRLYEYLAAQDPAVRHITPAAVVAYVQAVAAS